MLFALFEEEKNGKKGRVNVLLKPEEVSKAIGRGGVNIRLASELTGYEIDVQREGEEEDVELTEFADEIEEWIIADVQDDVVDPLPITEWRRAVDAIVSAQRDGRSCLLHCSAGRSRSGIAVVLAIAEIDGVVAADVVEDLTERGLWRGCHPGLLAALARQFGSC